MFKSNNTHFKRVYSMALLSLCAAILLGCSSTTVPTNSSSSDSLKNVKTFASGVEISRLSDPPPTPGSDDYAFFGVGDIKSELKISSLKQIAIVLTPQGNSLEVDSIDVEIRSDKGGFSLQALPSDNLRTFSPVKKTNPNITGYVFDFDARKVEEADSFFDSTGNIKLKPRYKRDYGARVAVYIVDKQSEIKNN